MEWTIVIGALVAALALAFTVWPLLNQEPLLPAADDSPVADLIARKDTLLRSLKEIEFDHTLGKLSDEDFQRLDGTLRRQAVTLLKQIEKVSPELAGHEAAIEAAVAERRGQPASQDRRHCSQCGVIVKPGDKFCAACGAGLGAP